ncbi:TetR/AcrR family transcriptional regulator [Roseibium aquae]|uniref:TetR/AcrR family transcriptional regulator n=1 Tax=Roseibium aquae TaxID=1323746 RepID=UPI00123E0461
MQEETRRRSQADRRADTRAALLTAARLLFSENGYADTSTPDIVKAANVTRGALYHHFEDKAALLRAVVEAEAQTVAEDIRQTAGAERSPLEAFLSGAKAYFKAMQTPGRAQLLLLEGPAVLGVEVMRDIDLKTGGGTLTEALRHAQAAGLLADAPIAPLSDLLSAAFDRAALAIANGEDRETYEHATAVLMSGLFDPS